MDAGVPGVGGEAADEGQQLHELAALEGVRGTELAVFLAVYDAPAGAEIDVVVVPAALGHVGKADVDVAHADGVGGRGGQQGRNAHHGQQQRGEPR